MTASGENLSERWGDASDKEEGGDGYPSHFEMAASMEESPQTSSERWGDTGGYPSDVVWWTETHQFIGLGS